MTVGDRNPRFTLACRKQTNQKAQDEARRSPWEQSYNLSPNVMILAKPTGIGSNVRTSLHNTERCALRGSPSVKRPKSSRSPEPPCKPGAYGATGSISVLM